MDLFPMPSCDILKLCCIPLIWNKQQHLYVTMVLVSHPLKHQSIKMVGLLLQLLFPHPKKSKMKMIPADDFSGVFIKSYTLYLDKTGFHNNT